eukprot:3744353-Amphidinium_carterae.1
MTGNLRACTSVGWQCPPRGNRCPSSVPCALTPPMPKANPAHPTNGLDHAHPGAAKPPARSPG